jgi:hypothetical protein
MPKPFEEGLQLLNGLLDRIASQDKGKTEKKPTGKAATPKPILSPYQKGVEKTLKQAAEAHVTEAIQAGIPPQEIEKKAGLDPVSLQNPGQPSPMGQEPQNTPGPGIKPEQAMPTESQTEDQDPRMGLLRKLIFSMGTGMVAAGGQQGTVASLLNMVSPKATEDSEMKSEIKESYRLNNLLKIAQIEQLNKTGQVPTSEELLKDIPPEEQEDYLIKPTKQTIRGIVSTVPILERKKTLASKQLEDLGNLDNTQKDLGAVVERLKTSGLQLGPGFSTRPGAISDMLGQVKGSEFAAMKADIGRNFQLYRKATTGVAAGYPELNMLAPNYPKATDTNEVFVQKSIDVMKDIQRNKDIMLDYFSKGGYAVSKLKKTQTQPTQEQPTSGQPAAKSSFKVIGVR